MPNHDSFTVNPSDAFKVREVYTSNMLNIYNNRHTILKNYFESIGIDKEYTEVENNNIIKEFSPYCLK